MTSPTTLRGLSWGHRRASGALAALTAAFRTTHPDIDIEWHDRSLAGFEHQDLAEVAGIFDLIIYDHPFSGDIAASRLFVPLDTAIGDLVGRAASPRYIAGNLDLYRYAGHVWGAPIDAATQNALLRPDLMAALDEQPPATWAEALALGERARGRGLALGAAFAKPHGGLIVAALMANQGAPWRDRHAERLRIDPDVLALALKQVAALAALCPPAALEWDAIDLHEAMAARDDLPYAPCVYGYATYGEYGQRPRLGFADFPGPAAPHHAGTAIGGTALGVSAASADVAAAMSFARFILSDASQNAIIPGHHGQPALRAAWHNPMWNAAYNGYYRDTRATIDTAVVRPRLPGYIGFQDTAGGLVAAFLRGALDRAGTVAGIMAAAHAVSPP